MKGRIPIISGVVLTLALAVMALLAMEPPVGTLTPVRRAPRAAIPAGPVPRGGPGRLPGLDGLRAIAVTAGVVVGAALNIMPIAALALLGHPHEAPVS